MRSRYGFARAASLVSGAVRCRRRQQFLGGHGLQESDRQVELSIDSIREYLFGAAWLIWLLSMALSCGGCAAAAATQLVPLAFQAATFTGVSVGSAVTGHDPTDDEEDTSERCDALLATPPYMGEIIRTSSGEAVRGLILGEQDGKTKWFLSTTITSLAALQFTPPVSTGGDNAKNRNFLAYAAAQPQNDRENNQLVAFLASFESAPGVLSIEGRNYRYAWVRKLPCFEAAL